MSDRERRRGRLHTPLVVALSVVFFACGAEEARRATESPAEAAATPPAAASFAPPSPSIAGGPGEAPGAETSAAIPVAPPSAPAREEVTFGTPVEEPGGEEELPRSPARPAPRPGTSHVFTNADLERYKKVKADFGMDDVTVVVDTTRQGKKPPEGEESGKLTPEELQRETSETQRQIESLTTETEALRRRIPSLHNPLLPRVAPTEDDALAESGMDNVERLARINEKIAENERALDQLRRRLAELHALSRADGAAEGSTAPQAP